MAEVAVPLAVTGWFVSPLISKLVLKGLSIFKDGMKGKLEHLQTITLPQIRQVIEKAEMLGREDEQLMMWLRELQDAAYEADNVLDEYDYELLKRQAKGKFPEAVISPLQSIASDSSFRSTLKKRLKKLDKIASRVHTFTTMLSSISNASSLDAETTDSNFVTGSEPAEQQIFGRDAVRYRIVDLLINGSRKPQKEEAKSSGRHEEEEAERRCTRQEKGKGNLKEDDGPKNIVNDQPVTGITIKERHGREGRQQTGPAARQGRDREDTLSDRHAKVPVPQTGAPPLRRGSEIEPGKAMEAISAEKGARESSAEDGSHKSECYHLQIDVPVLPIVGVGGVGKTTLAQYIYNNPKISEHFHKRMWIDMPQNFDEFEITSRMVESVHQDGCPTIRNFSTLQQKLQEGLHEKRFLLVLDNVWYDEKQSEYVNGERWRKLLAPLRHGGQGSVVLITSRTNLVAMTLGHCTMDPIMLEGLNEHDCFSLFKSYAFEAAAAACYQQRPDENIDHRLMEIGREIARKIVSKLGGLPLAAKVLGAICRKSRHSVEEWNKVLRIDIWDDITRVLALSFKRLPPLLRQCVAHHGLYPKGSAISGAFMVRAWIAEGFISAAQHGEQQESGDQSMEEIGSNCLKELVFRSFLQRRHDGRFLLHDLLHAVADSVSRHECIRIQKGEKKKAIPPTTKHLFIRVEYLDEYKESICGLRNLRSLLLFCNPKSKFTLDQGVLHSILNKSKRLRTLDLAGLRIDKLPDSIGDLKHLRCVNLFVSTVKTLPKLFHRLYHLLYLTLSKCNFDSVPKGLSELVNLRHLEADDTTLSMIPNLGRLTALQELKEFHVKKEKGHEPGQLKNLANLQGTLRIVNLENINSTREASEAKLHDKTQLKQVWLEWDERNTSNSDSAEMVLDGFQPPPQITFLGVKWYVGSRAPIWMQPNNLLCGSSLRTLILEKCEHLQSLPPLGQLFPNLSELRLKWCFGIRYLSYLPPNLITLELFYPVSLALLTEEELKIGTDGPQLELIQSEFFKRDSVTDTLKQNTNRIVNVESMMSWLESFNPVHNSSETVLFNIMKLVSFLKFKCIKEKLKMSYDGNVQQLPSSLQHLDLYGIFADGATLSECLSRLHSLASLKLSECWFIISLPSREVLSNLRRLREVSIYNCLMLISLGGLAALVSLERLAINRCPNLMTMVPSSDDSHDQSSGGALLPESLTHLIIRNCGFLDVYIERCLMGLTRLSELKLSKCQHMTSLPTAEELMRLTSLKRLRIRRCDQLVSVGGLHVLLSSLQTLGIFKCPRLFSHKSAADVIATDIPDVDDALSPPHGLSSVFWLKIDNLSLLPLILLSRKGLESLTYLSLDKSSQDTPFTREQEEWFQHLPSLHTLMFYMCEQLPSLPSNLTSLTRLKELQIRYCPQVSSLPTLPMSLECLIMKGCHPELVQRCQEGGPHWDLIKHIPRRVFI